MNASIKKAVMLLLLLPGAIACAAQVRFFDGSTDALREEARRAGKLVLIELYADWCGPCRRMEEVFARRNVGEYVDQRFVAARYDVDRYPGHELLDRYGRNAIPLLLIFDTSGELLARIEGAADARTLLRNLAAVLDQIPQRKD